jgi:hypothetical protein
MVEEFAKIMNDKLSDNNAIILKVRELLDKK